MSIYYKYEPYRTNMFILSYVDDFFYWYTYEALVKCFVVTLGKIFHAELLGYAHWFMSISTSHTKNHSISVYQNIYYTFIVAKYLENATVKTSNCFIILLFHLM